MTAMSRSKWPFSPIHGCLHLPEVGRLRRPHISPPIRKKKPMEGPDDEEEAYIDPTD
jgi:hypothetical protein